MWGVSSSESFGAVSLFMSINCPVSPSALTNVMSPSPTAKRNTCGHGLNFQHKAQVRPLTWERPLFAPRSRVDEIPYKCV